ncbi:S41 family peptidase [Gramella sp. KN1008]|uniref:S41 family peptidase n=1 Tax=Gramella sp. KN1008 TaxID=2529298 RepID=UPI00103A5317|nr:S41 family peptidase [Gramella sp. KN1008]TBW30015.1 peptidase S41 [Gramella sp. KN1008]
MNSNYLSIILYFLVLNLYAQEPEFSREEVLADLESLREALETAHYDLYAYTSREEFELAYEAARSSVDQDSLSLLEATSLYQRLAAAVDNGHTSVDFPVQSYIAYAQAGGTLFPLEVALEDDKALVRKNWSANDNIKAGSEILSINGRSIKEILSEIYPQISAERPYFKKAKLELFSFPRYYWQVFGKQDNFQVEILSNGTAGKYSLDAIDVIEDYETKRTEIISPEMKLEFMGAVAYLNPGGFGGDENRYKKFIDSAFTQINAGNSRDLIIDLRNNPGGDDAFSDYMVSYIADKDFKWNSRFTLKTSEILKEHGRKKSDTTTAYWQSILTHKNGEIYDYVFDAYEPQVPEKRFKGNVYVLVNRQSHSQSAVTAAQIQDYGFGTIVGEETGDYPSLYASIFQYELPETGIPVHISKGYIVRVNGSEKQEGVIPDIHIRDHLLDENDEILNGLLRRLEEKN